MYVSVIPSLFKCFDLEIDTQLIWQYLQLTLILWEVLKVEVRLKYLSNINILKCSDTTGNYDKMTSLRENFALRNILD